VPRPFVQLQKYDGHKILWCATVALLWRSSGTQRNAEHHYGATILSGGRRTGSRFRPGFCGGLRMSIANGDSLSVPGSRIPEPGTRRPASTVLRLSLLFPFLFLFVIVFGFVFVLGPQTPCHSNWPHRVTF
jgi:hypothetical protein